MDWGWGRNGNRTGQIGGMDVGREYKWRHQELEAIWRAISKANAIETQNSIKVALVMTLSIRGYFN